MLVPYNKQLNNLDSSWVTGKSQTSAYRIKHRKKTTQKPQKKNILIFIDNAVDLSKQRLKFDIRSNLLGSVNVFLRNKTSFF